MADPAQPLPPNLRFGRYEMLFRIAAGGMAEVYVARLVGEGGFEKLVALKRMLPTLAEDERFVGMFLDEGRVAANISSPHVVSTLDLGRADDDSLYLVMELVVGVSLSALTRVLSKAKIEVPIELAAEIIAQAALGLHDAHEARTLYGEPLGIVHRDISPQNVLVDVSGRVRITDFGVARAVERVTQTQSGEVKGKLGYFAPEQARAKPIDRRADVYALGIVAWELVTGRRLFAGDGPAETLLRVLEMEVPRVDEVRPGVPAALADAIQHALERDVEKRTRSAGDFAQAIRAAVATAGPQALGALVRERGGESLLRLEEGIRSQMPSSPSGRVGSSAKRAPIADEEHTTRTPSSVSRVVEKSGAGVSALVGVPGAAPTPAEATTGAAPLPPPPSVAPHVLPPTGPMPALRSDARSSSRWPLLVGVTAAIVLLALAGIGLALTRTPDVTASALPATPSIGALPAPPLVAVVPEEPREEVQLGAGDGTIAPPPSSPTDQRLPAPALPADHEAEVAGVTVAEDPRREEPVGTTDTRPAAPTGRVRPRVRHSETTGTTEAPTAGRRPDALRGMDDFEAELDR